MHQYVARRLLLFVPSLLGASILIFVLLRLVPGDIAEIIVYQAGAESASVQRQQVREIRAELGLDRPIVVQYLAWLGNALRGKGNVFDRATGKVLDVELLKAIMGAVATR